MPLPTVNAMAVLALRLPEVPLMVTVEVPAAAELLAVSVSTLDALAGFVPNDAVTPLGRPEAARVTLPLKPPAAVTVIVSVPPLASAIAKFEAEGESVKLCAGEPEVTKTLAAALGVPLASKANNQ